MQEEQQAPSSAKPSLLQPRHLAMVAPAGEQVRIHLSNATTWQKFSRQNTEMIVTKAGRRMFPSLSLDISGLEPAKKYELYVTLLLADQHTLKYQRGVWIVNGQAEAYPPPGSTAGLAYVHPDSPATGRHWTKQEVTFMKLKLTNKLEGFEDPGRNGSMIFAYSMHKYLPVVHICELPAAPAPDGKQQPRFYTSVTFPGTDFITVTAYQNPELTDLKIQFNPYAKGVRNQGDRAASCGSFLIDTFRPVLKPQLQQHHQPEDATAPPIEFGAYPGQSAAAYGHWQQPQHQQRRHHPYSLQTAAVSTTAAPSSPVKSPADAADTDSDNNQDEAKATAAAASAYYLSPYLYQQQQQYQQQYQLQYYHGNQVYYTPPHSAYYYGNLMAQPGQQVKLESTIDQQQHQESLLDSPLTPPPQQQQQLQHHQHNSSMANPAGGFSVTTPELQQHHQLQHRQSSSLVVSHNSHITDSSPSGISFNSPDV